MKRLIFIIAASTALLSLPAFADHGRHHGGGRVFGRPHVSVGLGFGYPLYWRDPWYDPWYYPSFGLQYRVWPQRVPRSRSDSADAPPSGMTKLYVYPAAGQSAEQTDQDRYECHVWASDQSGYDPTVGKGSAAQASGYSRAFVACLEGRNYVVK
jgi:hypothetical protein